MFTWSWLPRPISHRDTRPIYITGAPRCGSSWVGEVLGNCTGIRYVYEPFNHKWAPQLRGHLDHFTYLTDHASPLITSIAENAFQGRLGWKQLGRAAYRGYFFASTRKATGVILKDPTASLISEWAVKKFNARVLFIMRHPCGFASSLEALGWELNVNRLLRQENLMRDHLSPFINVLKSAEKDKWLTRGAFWGAIHTVFTHQASVHTDWLLCKYEDLCNDPVNQYSAIAHELGLTMNRSTRKKIQMLSTTESADSGDTRRNSREMPTIWQQRMSSGEIDAVIGAANEFGLNYY